jgi:MYXO-CTERM domain-containing protein
VKQYGKSWLVCAVFVMAAPAHAAPTHTIKQRMARAGIGVAAPGVMSDSFAAGAVLMSASFKSGPFRADPGNGTPNSFVRLAAKEPVDLDAGSAARVAGLSTLDSPSVAEPHAAMLLVLGLVGFVLLSRRRPSDHD